MSQEMIAGHTVHLKMARQNDGEFRNIVPRTAVLSYMCAAVWTLAKGSQKLAFGGRLNQHGRTIQKLLL